MFDVLVERKHPRLIEVFDRLECSLGGLTGEWFSRMFTTALPAETAARVWDCVMVEGPKVLFRAALSLIKVLAASFCRRVLTSKDISLICLTGSVGVLVAFPLLSPCYPSLLMILVVLTDAGI